MSINKNYSEGSKGGDFNYRLRILQGLQETINNTSAVDGVLKQILTTLLNLLAENKLDFEMKSVKDANGDVFQLRGTLDEETGVFNWDYIDASGNIATPVAPVKFLNPDILLTAIETELIDIGLTLDDILDSFHLEVDDDAIVVEQLLPTNINLLYGAFEGEGTEWERIQTDGNGRLKGIQDIIDELQATLDVNVTNATLSVTQSGAWTITSNQGTSPWVVSGTVALDAATLAALETITVEQGTSPWVIGDGGGSITVDGTVAATQSGTWDINNISGTISLPTGAATETTLALVNSNTVLGNITLNAIDTKLAPAVRTHNTISATGAGSVPAGSMCGSVLNVGNTAGTWNGISLPAGVSIPWAQIANRDTYGTISYDATGTTFIIEYTT